MAHRVVEFLFKYQIYANCGKTFKEVNTLARVPNKSQITHLFIHTHRNTHKHLPLFLIHTLSVHTHMHTLGFGLIP